MLKKNNLTIVLVTFFLLLTLALRPAWAVSVRISQGIQGVPSTVNDVARATTVLIGADLNSIDNVEATAGSGVIIAREVNTSVAMGSKEPGKSPPTMSLYVYWVLTNSHVVSDNIANYVIRTADGEFHNEGKSKLELDRDALENDPKYVIPTREIVRKLDCESMGTAVNCSGPDLAVLTFYSDNRYPFAALGDPAEIREGQPILVSGWPLSAPDESSRRHRIPLEANITEILQPGELNGNYTLVTTIRGKQGISGGPVFNRESQLIGIYGRGQGLGEKIGSTNNYAVDINQFFQLQAEPNYVSTFSISPPILTSSQPENLQETIDFGKKYAGQLGDNIAESERKNFYVADLLPDDPRIDSIKYLKEHLGCWHDFEDGKSGGGLLEARGQFVYDLSTCLDIFMQRVSPAEDSVTSEDIQDFKRKQEDLAERIARLRAEGSGSGSAATRPPQGGGQGPSQVSVSNLPIQTQGILGANSQILPIDGSRYEEHVFEGTAGQRVVITLESRDFDPYLVLIGPDDALLGENDDVSQNSLDSGLSIVLPADGLYRVLANTYDASGSGRYTLTVNAR
jgi:Trypsin-like peptidase domain